MLPPLTSQRRKDTINYTHFVTFTIILKITIKKKKKKCLSKHFGTGRFYLLYMFCNKSNWKFDTLEIKFLKRKCSSQRLALTFQYLFWSTIDVSPLLFTFCSDWLICLTESTLTNHSAVQEVKRTWTTSPFEEGGIRENWQ